MGKKCKKKKKSQELKYDIKSNIIWNGCNKVDESTKKPRRECGMFKDLKEVWPGWTDNVKRVCEKVRDTQGPDYIGSVRSLNFNLGSQNFKKLML